MKFSRLFYLFVNFLCFSRFDQNWLMSANSSWSNQSEFVFISTLLIECSRLMSCLVSLLWRMIFLRAHVVFYRQNSKSMTTVCFSLLFECQLNSHLFSACSFVNANRQTDRQRKATKHMRTNQWLFNLDEIILFFTLFILFHLSLKMNTTNDTWHLNLFTLF